MEIEIPIGTRLFVNDTECEVVAGRACSKCEVQKATIGTKLHDGRSNKCGTRYNGNTSCFTCDKCMRRDKTSIFFKAIKK